jgi:mannose-6-phosphate isomerase-like protein (cupin superfamily)
MMADKVNIPQKLDSFSDQWAPRIVARYNDNEVRLVKVEGEFIWHQHEDTDELFLVLDGTLEIELRDRTVTLNAGELFVVHARPSTAHVRETARSSCC